MIRFAVFLIAAFCVCADAKTFHGRVLGGHETTIEQFPHQVSLQVQGTHFCGGSILSNKEILTAANCFVRLPRDLVPVVRVGSTNRRAGGTVHAIEKVLLSPDFSLTINDCDAAVIVLKEPIKFSNTAKPIQLATNGSQPQKGENLTISGWGYKERIDTGDHPGNLRAVTIPYADFEHCRAVYVWYRRPVTENMFCAGGAGPGAAKGDFGGGIINGKKQLVGIISWGVPGCCPTVFTSVLSPKVRRFIDSVVHV